MANTNEPGWGDLFTQLGQDLQLVVRAETARLEDAARAQSKRLARWITILALAYALCIVGTVALSYAAFVALQRTLGDPAQSATVVGSAGFALGWAAALFARRAFRTAKD